MVLALVLIVFFAGRVFGSSDEPDPKPTAEPTSEETKTPSPDESCDPKNISIALNAGPNSIESGKDAAFDIAVTNNGSDACTIDLGDKSRVLTITSGSDRIWSSQDCATEEEASRLVLLRPGSANVATVVWDGQRSDKQCTSDLPSPRSGTYKLEIKMKDVDVVEHRFNIT